MKIMGTDGSCDEETYYTLAEARNILSVSAPTLWRLRRFRGLASVQNGGLVRIRKSVLDRWMEDHEANGNQTPNPPQIPGWNEAFSKTSAPRKN